MGRKRKIDLENEFEKIRLQHIRATIRVCLSEFEELGIYDMTPLLEEYKDLQNNNVEKAHIVETTLFEKYYKNEDPAYQKIYMDFYEICYDILRDLIKDNVSYNN